MSPRTSRHHLVSLGLGRTLCAGLAVPGWAAPEPNGGAPADDLSGDQEPDERAPISLRSSPAVLEVPHESGVSRHELRLDNTGSQPIRVVADTSDFLLTPDGTTQFLGPEEHSAASWVTVDTAEFELDPDERRDVEVTVDVPEDAEPGERYVSVIFAVPGTDGEGNITVTHRVAVKLYISVPGPQIHHLEFGELTAPRLVDSSAAHFELAVHNPGNIHRRFETPEPLIATSGDAEFRFENLTVLGDSTRTVEAVWSDPPTVCWCTVEVVTDDGRGNELLVSTRVIVFPLRPTLAMLGLLTGLAMLLAARRRRQAAARLERRLEEARREGALEASPDVAALEPTGSRTAPGPCRCPPTLALQPATTAGRRTSRRARRPPATPVHRLHECRPRSRGHAGAGTLGAIAPGHERFHRAGSGTTSAAPTFLSSEGSSVVSTEGVRVPCGSAQNTPIRTS